MRTSLDHRGLTLLHERAVWHAASRTLWVADVHLGKAAAFRALGQPVPTGTTRENFARLTALIERCGAERLIFLGDLFHSRHAHAPWLARAFHDWREHHRALNVVLIRGNHDHRAGDPSPEMRIAMTNEPSLIGAIEGRHYPLDEADALQSGATVLAGHLHPAVRLRGRGHDSLRCPCFVLQGRQIVLPSFGEFTGGSVVAMGPTTRAVALTDAGLITIDGDGRLDDGPALSATQASAHM